MGIVNGLLFPIFDFVAKNRWAQIVLGLGIFWLIFMAYLAMRDNGVRRVEREKLRVRQAEIKAAVNERSTQIIEEERTHADEALAARDGPFYPNSDSVPDELGRVVFRDQGGS